MGKAIRLTAAQAMVKWLAVQTNDACERFIEGVWGIFGHGNVAGLGEALHGVRDVLPTWRGRNEQTMAHAAIAFAKASKRRSAMAVTTSIGPGATNMVTATALAHVDRLPVLLIPGDRSYMMGNSKLATAVMRGVPFTVVLTNNRGFSCIDRLQMGTGGAEFNNLYASANVETQPAIDFVAHAASMGAHAEKASDIADLEDKIVAAQSRAVPSVIVIDTDPYPGTGAGGHWWDVAVPEVSVRPDVNAARAAYEENLVKKRLV